MKTISSLPPKLKGLALHYRKAHPNSYSHEDSVRSFTWSETTEGYTFWNHVNNNDLESAYFIYPNLKEDESVTVRKKQSLTREQLVTLYRSFDCMEWKRAIKPYLENSIFLKDDEAVFIADEDIVRAFRDASPSQKEALLAAHLKEPSTLPMKWGDIKFTGKHYYLDSSSEVSHYDTASNPVRPKERNLLAKKEDAEGLREYIQLLALRDAWREGWVPNWSDGTRKYGVRISAGEVVLAMSEKIQKTFSFQREQTAKKFIETFKEQLTMAAEFI